MGDGSGGLFSRAEDGGVLVVRGGVDLLSNIDHALSCGAALTFMPSSDGGAWAVSVLHDGERVGRVWVRSEDDLRWLVDCLGAITRDELARLAAVTRDSGTEGGSRRLAASQGASRGRRK